MKSICTLIALTLTSGWTSHYAPGVMEQVIENRLEWGHIQSTNYSGFTAVPECSRIGDVILARADSEWEILLITDCARENNEDGAYEWMVSNQILLEVDWETAVRWGAVGGGTKIQTSDNFTLSCIE